MTARAQLSANDALQAGEPAAPLSSRIVSIGHRLAAWAGDYADRCAAAAMYVQLSSLSDGELARRGLSRATLAHDVGAAWSPRAD